MRKKYYELSVECVDGNGNKTATDVDRPKWRENDEGEV